MTEKEELANDLRAYRASIQVTDGGWTSDEIAEFVIDRGYHKCTPNDCAQASRNPFPIKMPYGISESIKRSELRSQAEHKDICSSAAPITEIPCHICGAKSVTKQGEDNVCVDHVRFGGTHIINEAKLIKAITSRLEDYGMPKFKDTYPAIDILQLVKDATFKGMEKL